MEKFKPHYSLEHIKALLGDAKTRTITRLSRQGAVALGYMDDEDMVSIVARLSQEHFYKSMTTLQSSRIWQDVYKIVDEDKRLYLKVQLSPDHKSAVIVQFKRDEGGD